MNIVPVDSERHAGKGWRRPTEYIWAARETVAALVGTEFGAAAVCMPIAFIEQSGRYQPVAVLSPVQGRNLFISPEGLWLGSHVPAIFLSYPFRLIYAEGSDRVALGVDEDSGLVVDAGSDAHVMRFFEADGSPTAALKGIIEFLQQLERSRSATDIAVAALAEAGVIQPWQMQATLDNKQVLVQGLHGIDEVALDALDDQRFLELRNGKALGLAYAQLISMHRTGVFGQLAAI